LTFIGAHMSGGEWCVYHGRPIENLSTMFHVKHGALARSQRVGFLTAMRWGMSSRVIEASS